jgi:uncharacterized C2H2 Zn-finger protein
MAYASEKFCLKWNDFQQNIIGTFHHLRQDTDFSDVTLVCEDDKQIEGHQLILTACSTFFSRVLRRNKHSHPMIYMRGLAAKHLEAVMDYIYLGETNIRQEDLDAFLAIAEDLQLKGLTGSQNDPFEGTKKQITQIIKEENVRTIDQSNIHGKSFDLLTCDLCNFTCNSNVALKTHKVVHSETMQTCKECGKKCVSEKGLLLHMKRLHVARPGLEVLEELPADGSVLVEEQSFDIDNSEKLNNSIMPVAERNMSDINMDDLKTRISTMVKRIGEKEYQCTICGKTNKTKQDMERHVETHIEGVSYPCNLCDKVSRSRRAQIMHVSKHHKK